MKPTRSYKCTHTPGLLRGGSCCLGSASSPQELRSLSLCQGAAAGHGWGDLVAFPLLSL